MLQPHTQPRQERPDPPPGASNYVLLILDSCRYDSMAKAAPRNISRLGPIEKRYSYATWTAPSHYNLLMGLLPHTSPKHVFASTYYKEDFIRFQNRLGVPGINFAEMVPRMWMPHHLRNGLGYYTRAMVSLPVLNPFTPIATDFDSYELMDRHNDLYAMVDKLRFDEDRPTFYLLNAGETHYPYAPPDEPESQWPRIHGVHGVFKEALQQGQFLHSSETPRFFNEDRLLQLHRRQIRVLDSVDNAVGALFDALPSNTYVTITSDHGELFGEMGYFGHGPINHEKVLEVPFVEGKLR
jgi:hypothetical protein